jgi:hypothetical protein
MTNFSLTTLLKPLSRAICSAVALFATLPALSQAIAPGTALRPRITAPIENSSRVLLTGSRPPRANPADDIGAVPATMKLEGMSIVFSRTPAQQATLDNLVAAQQNPTSPLYHQWLSPEQFAARFGVADADIAAVESWLQSQGFSIDSVSRSRNSIFFSGNAGLVASAFGAPLHYFRGQAIGNQPAATHFAPSTDLSIPAALSSSVLAVTNLSSFRPHSQLKLSGQLGPQPQFTSGQSGNHFLTPGDMATIYDITPAYNSGLTGANQSIVIIGQTSVSLTDISNFQTAVGITGKAPIPVLVPSSGTAAFVAGDESESDLDLEYSSTIARGAQIYFVYTGNSTNYNAFDSLQYAVNERLAPIISSSYGACETSLGQSNFNALEAILSQAATQGQTVVSSAGDNGSTDCHGDKTLTAAQQDALSVDYPASSQYVTGMGGTEFANADVASGNNTYFTAAPNSSTDVVSSAKSYIPEMVWNDDAAFVAAGSTKPLSAGGGGISVFTKQPTWQTGSIGGVAFPTTGNGMRLVPDISLTASPGNAPFAYCTSDITAWATAANGVTKPPYQTASCNSGLRDSNSGYLTLAGGTSFDAPIFAGLVAIINQSQNSTGEGVINPILYSLATTSAYSTAFHDITSGGNQCLAGVTDCGTGSQTSVYAAATGYDAASGLGSIDFDKLLTAWPNYAAASAVPSSTTTLTAASTTPAASATDMVTITVAALNTSAMTPTGTVSLVVDGGAATSLTLTAGVVTYSFTSPTPGTHVLVATYSHDANFGASSGTLTLSIPGATTTGGPSFTIAASVPAAVTGGSSTSSTLSVAPAGGYTGTVKFTVGVPTGLTNFCYSTSNAVITSASNRPGTLTLYTSAATCNSLGLKVLTRPVTSHGSALATPPAAPASPWKRIPLPAALASMLLFAGFRRRSRLLRASVALGVLLALSLSGIGLTGCSNTSSSVTASNTPAGAYTITVTGTDSVTPADTATTTFTLTVN